MQLKNKYIFILGLMKFDSKIESTNFTIAKHLAKDNFVFYIDNPYTWKDYLLNMNTEAFGRRKKSFAFSYNEINDETTPNLKIVITPPLASINWLPEGMLYRSLLKMNEKIIYHRIKQIIEKYKIKNYIYINSFNFYYPGIAKMLLPDLIVYHCVDPLAFSFEQKHGLISEMKIVKESDLVICTSKQLFLEKSGFNEHTFLIPNAADIRHSNKALNAALPIHSSLIKISRPIIGYFGNIERRIDFKLLREVVKIHNDKSFVFAGPISSQHIPDWFYNTPNVYLTGPIPYEEMPQMLKGFDVAIIPFKKDAVSATIFPLKLFEYLGAGKAVVATDFNPDLKDYTGTSVSYCKDALSFSDAIDSELANRDEQIKQTRLAIASDNTWERRADEFAALIDQYLYKTQVNTDTHYV